MIGVLHLDDGVGVLGHAGTGHDALGGSGVERPVGGRSGGYVIGDRECDRGVRSGLGHVGVTHREPVHRRVGERRYRQSGGNWFGAD